MKTSNRWAAVLLMSALASSAQASLTFTFTTAGGGTILGQIDGLFDVAGSQAASAVIVNSFSGANFPGSFTVPYNFGGGGSFTVTGGALTSAAFTGFRSGNSATQFTFDLSAPSFNMHSFNNSGDLRGSNLAFSTFPASESVPEPQSLVLSLLALGALGLTLRAKRPEPSHATA